MCLLHSHPADTQFDEADIADFYKHNPDGVGVMWAQDNSLYVKKELPANATDAWKFYQNYCQGKECYVHWRMKTHGLIDITNCHPYDVFGDGETMPISLMHNGILSIGNEGDVTKSDTWHYVENYLKPLLKDYPAMFNNPTLIKLLEEHIGHGNRFIMLNHLGDVAIVNEADFVTYKGAKLSNTYAWSSEKGGFGFGNYNGYTYDGYIDMRYGNYATSRKYSTYKAPVASVVEVRRQTASFFSMLKRLKYDQAWKDLNFQDVEFAVEDVGNLIWADFVKLVEMQQVHENDIIDCVLDSNLMLTLLYEMDDVKKEINLSQQLPSNYSPEYLYDDDVKDTHLHVGLI